jgi:hypothetical protein
MRVESPGTDRSCSGTGRSHVGYSGCFSSHRCTGVISTSPNCQPTWGASGRIHRPRSLRLGAAVTEGRSTDYPRDPVSEACASAAAADDSIYVPRRGRARDMMRASGARFMPSPRRRCVGRRRRRGDRLRRQRRNHHHRQHRHQLRRRRRRRPG